MRSIRQQMYEAAYNGYDRNHRRATDQTDAALSEINRLNRIERNERIANLMCNPDHSYVCKLEIIVNLTRGV